MWRDLLAWSKALAAMACIAVNTVVVCLCLYAMWVARLPLPRRWRSAMSRRMDRVVDGWVSGNRWMIRALALTRVRVEWPEQTLSRDSWYLLVSNHQSWADILILQTTLRDTVPMIKFFTKRQLVFLPLAGLAMKLLGFPYVRRAGQRRGSSARARAERDKQDTLAACAVFRNHPTAVLSFLEGTRFTHAKHQAQRGRFQHLLNPKVGGIGYVLQGLREELRQLVDVTIYYPEGPPSFLEFLQGRCPSVQVSIKVIELDAGLWTAGGDVHRHHLAAFAESLWQQKDARLATAHGAACANRP